MALEFIKDAISLSGLTGSKLKCEVLGEYYTFWWNITSGGPANGYRFPTAIVELDAGTGEVYIKDTGETVLGSAGHALNLKMSRSDTEKLKIILVEKDVSCFGHLKNVIQRRWGTIDIRMASGPIKSNTTNIYLLNKPLDQALIVTNQLTLGNAIFYFDPLRSVDYLTLEKVANNRLESFYKRGTEFFIFLFTSDWFLGRDDFSALPTTLNDNIWTEGDTFSVQQADVLFGNRNWRQAILTNDSISERENTLVQLYRNRLHRWFRYVLPLPFKPKKNQVFHLLLCSNFSVGVRATRNFYCDNTGNLKYSPNNANAFRLFKINHPELFLGLHGTQRPLQWRILWKTVVEHEEGICDCMSNDLDDTDKNPTKREQTMEWLLDKEYLVKFENGNTWKTSITQYKLNWPFLKERLGIELPAPLEPVSPNQ